MRTTPPTTRRGVLRALPRRARRLAIVVVALLALGGVLLASLTQEPMRAAIWQRLGQSCGAITAARWTTSPPGAPALKLITDPVAAQQAEDCFMQGYARCQAVSLANMVTFFDVVNRDTVVVEPAEGRLAGCALADIAQGKFVGGLLSWRTFRCARVARQPDGLHVIGCGGGEDIVIASP